jgi:hypothetical protein
MDDVQLRSRARENEPAFVDGSVMRAAQRDEILDVVAAVLRPKFDVMHVREHRVFAARNATFPCVTAEHRATDRGRDGV